MNIQTLQQTAKQRLAELIGALEAGDIRKALESARGLCAVLQSLDRKARDLRQKTTK